LHLLVEGNLASSPSSSLNPVAISKKETLALPIILSWRGPRLGGSLSEITRAIELECSGDSEKADASFQRLINVWTTEAFVVGFDARDRVVVCLRSGRAEGGELHEAALKAYTIGCFFHLQRHKGMSEKRGPTRVDFIESLAPASLQFYADHITDAALNTLGWDVGKGKTRLPDLGWRFEDANKGLKQQLKQE